MTTHLAATFPAYTAQLRGFIHSISSRRASDADSEFNRLALELFGLQFVHNASYRKLCEARKAFPESIRDWREIPAVPTAAFKEWEMTCLSAAERTRVFYSSGTTGQQPSRHFHSDESLSIYDASLLPWFREHFPNGNGRTDFLMLTPPPEGAPNSSLVHMFETIRRECGSAMSAFTGTTDGDGIWHLEWQKTMDALLASVKNKMPLTILGTAFSFVHLLDRIAESGAKMVLPHGSNILETGGYKGRSRTMPKADLHALITQRLGVTPSHIICEYGMSELSSQAYDGVAGSAGTRRFHFPPWARAQIISPETGREAGEAETGLIRIFDLANVYSVMAIQTEDLGTRRGGGFELLGRAASAETRGCSLRSE